MVYVKRGKEVLLTDLTTGNTETFPSLLQCAARIGCSSANIAKTVSEGGICMRKFKVEYTGFETILDETNEVVERRKLK